MYVYNPYTRRIQYSPPYKLPVPYHYRGTFFRPFRQLQQANPTLFMKSAKHMQILIRDATSIVNKMADSKDFALQFMNAAQQSNLEKVNTMIKNTGIKTIPDVSYTPDGLKLHFQANIENLDCCHLTISLRWM